MKTLLQRTGWRAVLVVLAVALAGCNKGQSPKAAAEQLEKSFHAAETSLKQEVDQASTAFQSGNYAEAMSMLDRAAQRQAFSEAQKKAVDALIFQTRQAVHQNPQLNSRELYKAMTDLTEHVHGEN